MPIYTYRCESCGIQFERQQSFKDEPLKRCPECNKSSLRKVITPAGIVFKGSGWYATDHRSPSGSSRSTKADGKETSSTESPAAPATSTSTESASTSNPPPSTSGE